MPFEPHRIRSQFPILATEINGKPLVYLDNGATVQKPLAVLDASRDYYEADQREHSSRNPSPLAESDRRA